MNGAAFRNGGPKLEWLDAIPSGWSVARLGTLFSLQRRAVRASDEVITAFRNGEVTLRSRRRTEGYTEAIQEIGYQGVRVGDLVVHQMDAFAGAVGVSDSDGKSSPVYSVCTPRDGVSAHFFAYLLRYLAAAGYIVALARGIRERSTDFRWATAKGLSVPVPPLMEQRAIVEFLDRETADTNVFIADQEELIALLLERRSATISHAVVEGGAVSPRSPNMTAKSEPSRWTTSPFARVVDFREGPGIGAADFAEDGVPLIRVAGVRGRYATLIGCNYLDPALAATRWSHFRVRLGDLLVSASASMGTVSEVGPEVVGAIPYTGIIRMAPTSRLDRDYLRLFLQSAPFIRQINRLKTGSTIQHYGPEHLRQMHISFPPIHEQRVIAAQVDARVSEMDAAIAEAREAIALSRERRAALISAAVTGKIDVREHGRVA